MIPRNNTEFQNFVLKIRPNGSEHAWTFPGKLPNFLLFIPFGINQTYYTDFSKYEQVAWKDFQTVNFTGLQSGENLEPFSHLVPIKLQVCGSCMAFATAAVLSQLLCEGVFPIF